MDLCYCVALKLTDMEKNHKNHLSSWRFSLSTCPISFASAYTHTRVCACAHLLVAEMVGGGFPMGLWWQWVEKTGFVHTHRNRSRCSTCAEVHTLFMYDSKVHSHTRAAVCEHGTAGSSTEENKRRLPVTERREGDETCFTPQTSGDMIDVFSFHVNPPHPHFVSCLLFSHAIWWELDLSVSRQPGTGQEYTLDRSPVHPWTCALSVHSHTQSSQTEAIFGAQDETRVTGEIWTRCTISVSATC